MYEDARQSVSNKRCKFMFGIDEFLYSTLRAFVCLQIMPVKCRCRCCSKKG